jgi:hypothetical protein
MSYPQDVVDEFYNLKQRTANIRHLEGLSKEAEELSTIFQKTVVSWFIIPRSTSLLFTFKFYRRSFIQFR